MPEKIVYILGAGFSKLLGLPVMSNFLETAKDLFFSDREKYQHFAEVFGTIGTMHRAKTFCSIDLLNIEEVFSVLDMEDSISKKSRADSIQRFIKQVVEAKTPQMPVPGDEGGSARGRADSFFNVGMYRPYLQLVLGVCGMGMRFSEQSRGFTIIRTEQPEKETPEYYFITLNYDRVLETCFERLAKYIDLKTRPRIAKLHGCISGTIVPPTWRKLVDRCPELDEAWSNAFEWLSQATHIRFLGYSFPKSDAYMRYLIEAALMQNEYGHVKQIDTVCLDDRDHSVENRYREVILYNNFRFASTCVSTVLPNSSPWLNKQGPTRVLPEEMEVEQRHAGAMDAAARS